MASRVVRPVSDMCQVCTVVRYQFHHFGAFVCNRCRAFFRRIVRRSRKGTKISDCFTTKKPLADNNPICDITLFRGACQACRYVTCLNVGMMPNSVLTEAARVKKYTKKHKVEINEGTNSKVQILSDLSKKKRPWKKRTPKPKRVEDIVQETASRMAVKPDIVINTDNVKILNHSVVAAAVDCPTSETDLVDNYLRAIHYPFTLQPQSLYFNLPLKEPPWVESNENLRGKNFQEQEAQSTPLGFKDVEPGPNNNANNNQLMDLENHAWIDDIMTQNQTTDFGFLSVFEEMEAELQNLDNYNLVMPESSGSLETKHETKNHFETSNCDIPEKGLDMPII